jgi:hypothetical protein
MDNELRAVSRYWKPCTNHSRHRISMRDTTILIAKRFLFIGALTIPFDIRDLFDDRKDELKNHPGGMGRKKCLPVLPGLLLAGYVAVIPIQK